MKLKKGHMPKTEIIQKERIRAVNVIDYQENLIRGLPGKLVTSGVLQLSKTKSHK